MSLVSVVRFNGDLRYSLTKALKLIGGFGMMEGGNILIKPNICLGKKRFAHIVTNPEIVDCIIDEVVQNCYDPKIRIVESDSVGKNIDKAFSVFGYHLLVEKYKKKGFDISLINLSKGPATSISFKDLRFDLKVSKVLLGKKYFISITVPKTHPLTTITGSLKNQFGCLSEPEKDIYHKQINKVIPNINMIIRPSLCIVDGRISIEDQRREKCKKTNFILCSRDTVAVDSTLARLIGFIPENIPHITFSHQCGLGSMNPITVGKNIESLKTKLKKPRKNIIELTNLYTPNFVFQQVKNVYRTLRQISRTFTCNNL